MLIGLFYLYNEYMHEKEGFMMDVSYNKLFKLLIDKGWKKMEFVEKVGISQNTMAKISKNQYVSMEVLVKMCRALDCTLDDIIEINYY